MKIMKDILTKRNLEIYYKSINDPNLDKDIQIITSLVNDFVKKYKWKIANMDDDWFLEMFEDDDTISYVIVKVGRYLWLKSAINTQDQEILKKEQEFQEFITDISNKLIFVDQELKEFWYEKLIEFSQKPKLKDYQNRFVQKANSIKYLLDYDTEYALNLKSNATSNVLDNLQQELVSSFIFRIETDWKAKFLTEAQVRKLRYSVNPQTRKKAFDSIRRRYLDKKVQITLGNVYASVVKDRVASVKLRWFSNVMQPRNLSEEMHDEVVQTLLDQVNSSVHLYQRYNQIKAKLLWKDKLRYYDVFAPLQTQDKKIPFQQGLDMFLDCMKKFDQEFFQYSKKMFENWQVDVFPKRWKRWGAFASSDKDHLSFILLNYSETLDDVSAIAHEMGHAIHWYFSQQQPRKVYDTWLCLAETASVFNELVFADYIKSTLQKEQKIDFLSKQLENAFATIFRQVQYVNFEKAVHQSFYEWNQLTYKDLNKLWRYEQLKMSADTIEYDVPEYKECTWSQIPHIFAVPFYCYAYAFGNILSFALYQKYRQESQNFIPKYKQILSKWGSMPPKELMSTVWIDISSKQFYNNWLKTIQDMLEEFESLV